jgi:hypothetical protein
VALTSPLPGSVFGKNICMGVKAADDTGVTKVEFRVDSKLVMTETVAPFSYTWTAPAKTTYGTHTVSTTAYDAAGLTATSQVTVTRTKSAPGCSYPAPTG